MFEDVSTKFSTAVEKSGGQKNRILKKWYEVVANGSAWWNVVQRQKKIIELCDLPPCIFPKNHI